ncbi:MAG TPA: hypothetical protein VE032_09935 [Actinomycetota bacterium]|nr:hypothetical protein [Actinomycetota bacterium]
MRRIIASAIVTVALLAAACGGQPTDLARTQPSASPAAAELDVAGTWISQDVDRPSLDDALGAEFSGWVARLAGDLAQPLTLTLKDGDYQVTTPDGDVVRDGRYQVDGEQLKLQVRPNGVTVLDVSLDGDAMRLAFVSNSTQQFPPSVAPEEAVQRALFTAVPFVRA